MAICERGYLCEVCGGDVAELAESDLYLRYVLGEVDPGPLPPLLTAARELVIAGIAIRRLQMKRRRAMRFVAPSMPRAREASRR